MTGRDSFARTGLLWWVLRAQWAWGLLLLALLTEVSRAAIAATGAAFLAGGILDRAGVRPGGLHRLTVPFVALAVAASAADLFLGSGDFLYAVSVLVLGIQSVKFLLPKNPRDGWQLCAISFLEFLAAAGSTTEIQFAAGSVTYLGLCAGGMWALQAWQREEEGEAAVTVRPRFAAKILLLSTAGGILLTAVLFAMTPRVGMGQILRRLGRTDGITGFSDTISLRDVTGVKADRRVVARVEFPSMPPGESPLSFYLRGAAYSRFDGTAWKRAAGNRRRVQRSGFLYLVSFPRRGTGLHAAEITLEAMDHPVLFVYGNPARLEGGLGEIWEDPAGSLSLSQPGHAVLRYRLLYSTGPPGGAIDRVPPDPRDLELPPGSDDIRDLAAQVTAGGKSDAEKAALALRHFRSGYRYTITRPASSVREFLFSGRAGHCEHYATALALLLRASGIPARVAAGYLGGEWSDVGKYLIVRQSDAHAWTEARIGGTWVTMDATPALGEGSPFFTRTGWVGMYLDWARQRWNKYVVDYSLKVQAETVSEGWAAFRRARKGILGAFASGGEFRRPGRMAAVVLPAILVTCILLRRMLRPAFRRERDALRARGESRLPRPYERLVRRLSARGRRRSPGTTLEEMLLRASRESPPLADNVSRFLALYHRDRFGASPLSSAEFREACRLADRLGRDIPGGMAP